MGFKVTTYPHGTFSWTDCSSTDAAKATDFYTKVMGWTTEDVPMGEGQFYTFFKKDGETVAAISQMQPDMQAQGIPSHWSNYITVDDADAIAAKAGELGATVIAPPFDVFDNGRMTVIQDPTGANIAFWQAKSHIGATLVNTVGALCWNELMTTDIEKAKEFYGALLGWEFQKMENMEYFLVMNKGRMNGGMMPMPDDAQMPSNWTAYFNVDDVDAVVAKAQDLGGTVFMPATDSGAGRFAVVGDPAGAPLAYIQASQADEWVE